MEGQGGFACCGWFVGSLLLLLLFWPFYVQTWKGNKVYSFHFLLFIYVCGIAEKSQNRVSPPNIPDCKWEFYTRKASQHQLIGQLFSFCASNLIQSALFTLFWPGGRARRSRNRAIQYCQIYQAGNGNLGFSDYGDSGWTILVTSLVTSSRALEASSIKMTILALILSRSILL